MRVTIFAAGSRGDIQPCALLGVGLQRAGFDVLFAAPQNFAGFVQQLGLRFHPLRGDVQAIMAGDAGRAYMERGGANPITSMLAMRAMLGQVAAQMAEDALAACVEADALIGLGVFAPFSQTIADLRGIPLIHVEPTPLLPSGDFPAAGWPLQRNLGRWHNRLSGHAMLALIWQWYAPVVNSWRRRFGLPAYGMRSFYRILAATPLLGAYSPSVIPHPPDWSARVHITGYWFAPDEAAWEAPPELVAFLAAGEPPVYVGFGSMTGRDPTGFAATVLEALARCGRRAVLLTGWGALQTQTVPDSVFVLESAPHAWLFPRMAAVVHHGGAGTTAEGLRAGVPTVIVPFIVDQPFWGRRVHELGVGPEPVPRNKLSAAKLADAIEAALRPPVVQRAAALGQAIRAEQGLAHAVELVGRILGE